MVVGRAARMAAVSVTVMACIATAFVLASYAYAGTGPGASGNTITNAAQAQSPFTPGTFDSNQPIDVVVPTNSVLTPGATIFILECAAPNGVNPTTITSCDGNTGYSGGTVSVNSDGSIDVIKSSTLSGLAYNVFALPDTIQLGESPTGIPKCGLGAANECVLYIGQGGGSDPGLSQPHFFSQAFQVHPDPTDSGALSPGDGTFPADSAPAITSVNHTTFTKGTAGSFTVTATGYGPPTFTETGALPTGVTLKTVRTLNSSSGTLAGTPTQSGTFPITFTATNGVGSPASQSFTLTVNSSGTAPVITSANHTTFTQGTAGSFTVTATGSPTPTLAESGALPAGVTFTPGTGVLAGTPTVSGTFPITFTATNGVGSPASQSFTLTVNSSGTAPVITSVNHATFVQGTAGSFTVTATGSPTPTLAESGALPAGVTFTPGTGVLAGTPTVSGTFPITFTATNGVGSPATQSFTLTVNSAPVITSVNHATFVQGTAGSFTVTATGSPTPTLAESGALPAGVTFTPGTGVLAGTPTVSGTFPITFTATNGVGLPASQSFTLTVNSSGTAPVITSVNHATFVQGTAGSFTVTATGSPTPTFSETGTLPTGVLFSSAGVLSGTPTQSGSFPITIKASNGVAPDATQSFTLTVNSAPAITSVNHTTFTQGTAGSFTVTATGSPTPTLAESGALPAGVTFTPGTGVLAGTPTVSGTFPITFTATNGVGSPASQSFTLTVNSSGTAPVITSVNHATFVQGTAGSFTVTATGSPTPTLAESGALPAGVTFTPGTGVLAGTPTVSGTFPITFTATNGVGSPATQSFTLTVNSSGTGPTVTLHKSTGLIGNQSDAISGTGWAAGDSTVTLSECTTATFTKQTCDGANQVSVTLGDGSRIGALKVAHAIGTFKSAKFTIVAGAVAKKATCGLAGSIQCFIVGVGDRGDSVSVALDFSVPTLTAKKTLVPGNYVDPIKATSFPIGDIVIARECDGKVKVPATVFTHCDPATELFGTVAGNGRVAFSPNGVRLLVGSVYSDSAGQKCWFGGTCKIVVTDSSNPAIGLDVAVTFDSPTVLLKRTTGLKANSIDSVKATGFPIGDSVVARECDGKVKVPATISTHCDAATEIAGTVAGNGQVAFSPTGVKILVGGAYSDKAGGTCLAGGSCEIVVTDSSNAAIRVKTTVSLA